jgi:hypothetical protein
MNTGVKLEVSMENALTQMEEASRLKSELESIKSQIPPQFSGLSTDKQCGPEVNRPDPGLFQAARVTLREINGTLLSDLNRFTNWPLRLKTIYRADARLAVARTYDQTAGHGFGVGRLTSASSPASWSGRKPTSYEKGSVQSQNRARPRRFFL